ncbi:ModD protein [Rhodoblastus sp.]|uniref:ModD protein n=1 Tax=Rhodoblastus sp. TaxID=1962975 RepID=UPI003F9B221B
MSLCLPRAALEALLFEDAPYGDLTTEALSLTCPGLMRFEARAAMVAALVEEAACLLELAGATVEIAVASGAVLAPGARILSARGPAASLLRGWKVAQTLIEIWSGVATCAREIVEAAPGAVVACTRKNSSGAKAFAVAAVRAGGATMHRLGLSETILVFPEHRAFLEGETLAEMAARLRRAAPEKMLAIEVKTLDDGIAAAFAGFDVIQAEKFAPEEIARLAEALRALPKPPRLAAAGGIAAANAAAFSRAGAQILVTSAPYFAPPRDVQVVLTRLSSE